jgi:phosphohistidine phosphatase SixA
LDPELGGDFDDGLHENRLQERLRASKREGSQLGYPPLVLARRTFVLGLLVLGCRKDDTAPPSARVVRVVLVRHAEKETEASLEDPPLTPAGQQRAAALVQAIGEVQAILSTDTVRTRQTATPVAEASGVTIELMEPMDVAKIRAVVDRLDGGTLLVVGHSNTLPVLIEALSGQTIELGEEAYGDLFIVHLGDAPKLERARF